VTPSHLAVCVVYAAPGIEAHVEVTVPTGATVDDAIARSGIMIRFALDPAQIRAALFGQRVSGETPLAEGDRVELTRPLVADPKQARRKRARGGPKARKRHSE
jgi:hypothetical protein